MQQQLKFRDNYGTIKITNRGRPYKNPKESLGAPLTVRLYEAEELAIKNIQFEHDLNRNEVVQKCIQVGTKAFRYLDWINNNLDTIEFIASKYDRKR